MPSLLLFSFPRSQTGPCFHRTKNSVAGWVDYLENKTKFREYIKVIVFSYFTFFFIVLVAFQHPSSLTDLQTKGIKLMFTSFFLSQQKFSLPFFYLPLTKKWEYPCFQLAAFPEVTAWAFAPVMVPLSLPHVCCLFWAQPAIVIKAKYLFKWSGSVVLIPGSWLRTKWN